MTEEVKPRGPLAAAQKRIAELEAQLAAGPVQTSETLGRFVQFARDLLPGMIATKPMYCEPNPVDGRLPNLLFMQDLFKMFQAFSAFEAAASRLTSAKDWTRDMLPLICQEWPKWSNMTEDEVRARLVPGAADQQALKLGDARSNSVAQHAAPDEDGPDAAVDLEAVLNAAGAK